MTLAELIEKYDVPAPRYTSYPTVPCWSDNPTQEEWVDSLRRATEQPGRGIAVYLHLPFCETLCTYCGCSTIITKDHEKESDYGALIDKEIGLYGEKVPELAQSRLSQLHLGGGSPTFFSPEKLREIITSVYRRVRPSSERFEASVEVDPRRCSREQLETFRELGFSRVSLGVQDFNPTVQKGINRIQPFEMTERVTREARELGFCSINFDLVYGLPYQDEACIRETCARTLTLRPDRIAFYSFAVIPWLKPAQKKLLPRVPSAAAKRRLYEVGRELLTEAGYREIGMDHFALPDDPLHKAFSENKLHRNFMGYLEHRNPVLIGLGLTSISESPDCYHQNEKDLGVYAQKLDAGELPTLRGHKLSDEDKLRKQQILSLMTRYETAFLDENDRREALEMLSPLLSDNLIEVQGDILRIPQQGRPFLRNVCVAFDARLRRKGEKVQVFSRSI